MEWLLSAVDVILHLSRYLADWTALYGPWIYGILFVVIFAETGFVITPFLPGDSLLFIAGSLAALGSINVHLLVLLLFSAAALGNIVNYEMGRLLGMRFFVDEKSRWLNPHYIERTHAFFEHWGGLAVILARFVPFLRTYVPFVAGLGAMSRVTYIGYTFVGAALWVGSITYLGYFFGNIPWVKENQGLLVIAIVIVSVIPVIVGLVKARLSSAPAKSHSVP
jgi:membrane-associated protein